MKEESENKKVKRVYTADILKGISTHHIAKPASDPHKPRS